MWEVARDMSALLRSMTCAAPLCMAGPCLSSMWEAALPMVTPAAPTAPASNSCDGCLKDKQKKEVGKDRNFKERKTEKLTPAAPTAPASNSCDGCLKDKQKKKVGKDKTCVKKSQRS